MTDCVNCGVSLTGKINAGYGPYCSISCYNTDMDTRISNEFKRYNLKWVKLIEKDAETIKVLKEQQMTHKFKVGDRVKYKDTAQKSWIGSAGTILSMDGCLYKVKFDEGSPCLTPEYNNTIHTAYESKLELIPMQDKVLIKPEDYYTLKKDDEVEITVKGKFSTQAIAIAFTSLKGKSNTNYAYKDDIISLYKLIPKATKLEVGEIICSATFDAYVATINYISRKGLLFTNNQGVGEIYRTAGQAKTDLTHWYRKSGIPIDWEATFS